MMIKMFPLTLCLLLSATVAQAADGSEYKFHGRLVAEPCTLLAEDEAISVDFGTVIDKDLYLNQRGNGKPFTLHLQDCDTTQGASVKMKFSGTESSTLPGLLSVSGVSGVAIGLETPEGAPLPLNQAGTPFTLQNGNNTLTVKAYIQGEPSAIASHSIGHGEFTSVATFELIYE
ncbi:MAG: fimbrial protein [Scandinavium sp.]|uniref:fimbrial protein n=1 Tax=Scandinavium sp. TaxID=2830653 RepID=UPI003F33060C